MRLLRIGLWVLIKMFLIAQRERNLWSLTKLVSKDLITQNDWSQSWLISIWLLRNKLWTLSNITANTWILYDLIGVQNGEDSHCSLMKIIDKSVSLLSAHMNVFDCTYENPDHTETTRKCRNVLMAMGAIDVLSTSLEVMYIKAIIRKTNYPTNGITHRYPRHLAPYQFLIKTSQD